MFFEFFQVLQKKLGLCPSRGLAAPPPYKKLQIEFAREAAYRMSLIEIRLGGWGSEGPTLGRHVSACATILRLRALLYLGCVRYYTFVRHISACASIL